MSNSRNPISEMCLVDGLTDRFRNSLNYTEPNNNGSTDINKPDFKELDLGSPVSTLPTRPATSTTSSSSSSGSMSGQNPNRVNPNYSGELSGSVESSRRFKPGHTRSRSDSYPLIYSGKSSVSSFPIGNICPSGKILKTTIPSNKSAKNDILGSSRTGNYGHGSIIRGGIGGVDSGVVKEKSYDQEELKKKGNFKTAIPSNKSSKSDILGSSGTGNYLHGNIIRGSIGGVDSGLVKEKNYDPEELKRIGNENYKKGNFTEALSFYDKAIAICPGNAACHCNRAAALIGLKQVVEAVKECEEAIRLDPSYFRAHQRLGSLLLCLGQVENARNHMCIMGHQPDHGDLLKLQGVEKHIGKCTDARRVADWWSTLREADAAIAFGADASPQLLACRAEALLKLHRLEDAELSLSNAHKLESSTLGSQSKNFGMLSEAYLLFVQSQLEMALGRFENALTTIERAGQIDPQSIEVSVLSKNVRLVGRARARGNNLFKSERYTEACAAYGEGLRLDSSNAVLYCNRAACWYKLRQWEKSVDDCDQALCIQPNYTKALLRKASSNTKLERWAETVRDYEVLRKALPYDNEVAESLFHAQVALKKSRGEDVYNMKFVGEVELVSGLEQFRAAISSPGAFVVYFEAASNLQCKQISPILHTLSSKYPSIHFLKVDVDESPAVATAENVKVLPTFKIYKQGNCMKEMVSPNPEVLESLVRHYTI
ncbi:TPR repeat-containing thioredoxin TTL1-like [Lycium barbarum]|uniref:TPR repeat-containing thioredoxin TTL1-like n=1 Tax=Lycium barbarum TaxID=112863 RepID=UPI00293ED95D|nr:TPR repeat-containing thioredoxin TTL1-like [Lycium barbarum]